VAVGRDPRHMAISPDGDYAYVAICGSHYVSKIDIRPLKKEGRPEFVVEAVREVKQIHMAQGSHPYSLAIEPSGGRAFVANTQSSRLAIVDLKHDKVVAEVELGSKGARAVVFTPDGFNAFVSIENHSELAVIHTPQLIGTQRIAVGGGPRGLALD